MPHPDGSTTLAEQAYSPLMFARSMRAAMKAGRPWVLIPFELCIRLGDAVANDDLDFRCGEPVRIEPHECLWVCLGPLDCPGPHEPPDEAVRAAWCLREQMDPEKRLQRRLSFELEQLYAEGPDGETAMQAESSGLEALEEIYGGR
jgi:hypothetical protein